MWQVEVKTKTEEHAGGMPRKARHERSAGLKETLKLRGCPGEEVLWVFLEVNLVGRGWHFCMPGHRLILRPMSKPGGALPARYTHCYICACPCSACCGFCSLLWGEY